MSITQEDTEIPVHEFEPKFDFKPANLKPIANKQSGRRRNRTKTIKDGDYLRENGDK